MTVRALCITAVAAIVLWTFECCVRDVLEYSPNLVDWVDIPGPYEVVNGDYRVVVPTIAPQQGYWRVRRWWGQPWTTTEHCLNDE